MPFVDECEERVVTVQDDKPTSKVTKGGGAMESSHAIEYVFLAKDPDYINPDDLGRFTAYASQISTGNDAEEVCPTCLLFFYRKSPLEYSSGEDYESIARISGLKGDEFKQVAFEVFYSNGFETISKKRSITFIPKSDITDGSCMTYDEVLVAFGITKAVEEVEEEEVLFDTGIVVEIEVDEVIIVEKVDYSAFFE